MQPVDAMAHPDGSLHSGTSAHLTHNKQKQFNKTDSGTKVATAYTARSLLCTEVQRKMAFICSQCQDEGNSDIFFCGTKSGKPCDTIHNKTQVFVFFRFQNPRNPKLLGLCDCFL